VTSPTPSRRGGGGSPAIQWRREETPLAAPHGGPAATVEGFQVSKRGSGIGKGFSRQRGITKGIVTCTSDIMPTLYISCQLCVCRANKELCLGYK
jgi:hypothetical protein